MHSNSAPGKLTGCQTVAGRKRLQFQPENPVISARIRLSQENKRMVADDFLAP
jgi:hypothetical protein